MLVLYRGQSAEVSSLHPVIALGQTVKESKSQELNLVITVIRRCMLSACKYGKWIEDIPSSGDQNSAMSKFSATLKMQ